MKSIVLIIPYFGKWPLWFEAHLLSIKANPTIHWLFVTDCVIPESYPSNISFQPSTLVEFNERVEVALEMNIVLNYRKICDIRPAFGHIFQKEIKQYDFWGFCDVDIVWGDIRSFMTPQILNNFDVVSALENMLCGHFTLFRNNDKINNYYKQIDGFVEKFESPQYQRMDEFGFSNTLRDLMEQGKIKLHWTKSEIDKGIESMPHQEYAYDRWEFREGKIFDLWPDPKDEYMYLHFINWKVQMYRNEVKYAEAPTAFYISSDGLHLQPHSKAKHLKRKWGNFFNGYNVKKGRRFRRHKRKSLWKRIKNKF